LVKGGFRKLIGNLTFKEELFGGMGPVLLRFPGKRFWALIRLIGRLERGQKEEPDYFKNPDPKE